VQKLLIRIASMGVAAHGLLRSEPPYMLLQDIAVSGAEVIAVLVRAGFHVRLVSSDESSPSSRSTATKRRKKKAPFAVLERRMRVVRVPNLPIVAPEVLARVLREAGLSVIDFLTYLETLPPFPPARESEVRARLFVDPPFATGTDGSSAEE
jgi:hypothetical protein